MLHQGESADVLVDLETVYHNVMFIVRVFSILDLSVSDSGGIRHGGN